jgi:hypothetical protein
MKKKLFIIFILTVLLLSKAIAQITRGVTAGEIYITNLWYINEWGDAYLAVFHSTDNGQTLQVKHKTPAEPPAGEMRLFNIIADATPGSIYNYGYGGFWFSSDFGETWHLRETMNYGTKFWSGVNSGLIFKGNYQGFYKSTDYGFSFNLLPITITCPFTEVGFSEPEFYGINGQPGIGYDFVHTMDYGQTFTEKAIDSTVAFWQLSGVPPRIYRGSQPGEVYLSSWWPDLNYKIFYSNDTGTSWEEQSHSTDLTEWGGGASFTPGVEPGSFYVAKGKPNPDDPYHSSIICIDYSTDYGETFTTYCHTLDSTTTFYTANAKIENALFELNAFPNPFSGSITIEYKLPGNCISPMLTITDLHGRVLRNFNIAGTESIQWDGTDSNGKPVANGLYFYTIQAGNRCSGFNKIAVFR